MIKIAPLLAPALVLALTGCSLAPQYQRPEMELPQAWDATSSIAIQTRWWERFHDDTLNALVEEALANNRNIAQAMVRLRRRLEWLAMPCCPCHRLPRMVPAP